MLRNIVVFITVQIFLSITCFQIFEGLMVSDVIDLVESDLELDMEDDFEDDFLCDKINLVNIFAVNSFLSRFYYKPRTGCLPPHYSILYPPPKGI